MDDRIKELKEGAGREESRINEDFIEFLQKWSTPALLVLAAVAVAYWGWNQYKAMQVAKVNRATAAYTSATLEDAANPDTLGNIAEEFGGVRSFGLLARLDLADVYVFAVQRGLAPGVEYSADAELVEGDVLDEGARAMYLERATGLYQEVYDKASVVAGKEPLAIEAAFGLAAAAQMRDDPEGARTHLSNAGSLADKIGYEALSIVASRRAAKIAEAGPRKALYEAGALPPLPEPEPVEPPALPDEGGLPAPEPETVPAGESSEGSGDVAPADEGDSSGGGSEGDGG